MAAEFRSASLQTVEIRHPAALKESQITQISGPVESSLWSTLSSRGFILLSDFTVRSIRLIKPLRLFWPLKEMTQSYILKVLPAFNALTSYLAQATFNHTTIPWEMVPETFQIHFCFFQKAFIFLKADKWREMAVTPVRDGKTFFFKLTAEAFSWWKCRLHLCQPHVYTHQHVPFTGLVAKGIALIQKFSSNPLIVSRHFLPIWGWN